MIHLCMEKTLHCARFYLNWFQIFDQIWTKFLDQIGPKDLHTLHSREIRQVTKTNPFQITFLFSFFSVDFCDFRPFPQSFLFLNDITNPAYQVWGRS